MCRSGTRFRYRWTIPLDIRWHKPVALGSRTTAPTDRYISINRKTANTFCWRRHCRCRICVPVNRSALAIDPNHRVWLHRIRRMPNTPETQRIEASRRHRCTIVSIVVHGSFYRISYIHLVKRGKKKRKTRIKISIKIKLWITKSKQELYSLELDGIRRYCVLHCCCWSRCSPLTNNNPWLPLDTCYRSYLLSTIS